MSRWLGRSVRKRTDALDKGRRVDSLRTNRARISRRRERGRRPCEPGLAPLLLWSTVHPKVRTHPLSDGDKHMTQDTQPPQSGTPVVVGENLTKVYRMGEVEVVALRDASVTLYESEMVVLLGASGSGKSTLLNILGCLDSASSGALTYRGTDLSSATERARTLFRREHVGFVFQFYNLIPSLTARENVQLVTDIASAPMSADEALELVGLSERRNHFPAQLSGGEQQRVAIARAIAKRPDVLMCDEPTGALDYRTGVRVLDVLERANRELGTTTAIITHNAPIAAIADRVITISDGTIQHVAVNASRASTSELRW